MHKWFWAEWTIPLQLWLTLVCQWLFIHAGKADVFSDLAYTQQVMVAHCYYWSKSPLFLTEPKGGVCFLRLTCGGENLMKTFLGKHYLFCPMKSKNILCLDTGKSCKATASSSGGSYVSCIGTPRHSARSCRGSNWQPSDYKSTRTIS